MRSQLSKSAEQELNANENVQEDINRKEQGPLEGEEDTHDDEEQGEQEDEECQPAKPVPQPRLPSKAERTARANAHSLQELVRSLCKGKSGQCWAL